MTQNLCERKGQFQLYFPWYFLNTSHNVSFFIARFFQFKNRQGFGKCCLPLINMGVAHNHSLNVSEQGVSYGYKRGRAWENFDVAFLQATAEESCAFVS